MDCWFGERVPNANVWKTKPYTLNKHLHIWKANTKCESTDRKHKKNYLLQKKMILNKCTRSSQKHKEMRNLQMLIFTVFWMKSTKLCVCSAFFMCKVETSYKIFCFFKLYSKNTWSRFALYIFFFFNTRRNIIFSFWYLCVYHYVVCVCFFFLYFIWFTRDMAMVWLMVVYRKK